MANKEFQQTTKETVTLIKKLTAVVPETGNAAEYGRFLKRTQEKAKTFDKADPTYIDYVARGMKPKKDSAAAKPEVKPAGEKKKKEPNGEAKRKADGEAKPDKTEPKKAKKV